MKVYKTFTPQEYKELKRLRRNLKNEEGTGVCVVSNENGKRVVKHFVSKKNI